MDTNKIAIPIAIIVAGGIIAGALYFSNLNAKKETIKNQAVTTTTTPTAPHQIPSISASDHILGNPNADIVIVEYSDTECPYCKLFNPTLNRLMTEYGKDGKVAWVYRHFPIAQLHSKAPKEAEATECVNEIGGPAKFWQYLNMIYDQTPGNNGLDPAQLTTFASTIGINTKNFTTCLNSGKYSAKIQASYDEAVKAGAQGTPYSVLITKDGSQIPVVGAESYEALKSTIDTLLSK